jgi:hypothetical protein
MGSFLTDLNVTERVYREASQGEKSYNKIAFAEQIPANNNFIICYCKTQVPTEFRSCSTQDPKQK